MFVRKKRGTPARRAKGKAKKSPPRPPRPLGEGIGQRHLDLIGLVLIAVGVFFVFVLFFGWDGGKVGNGCETALTYLLGDVGARIATVFMIVAGVVLVTGPSISAVLRGFGRGLRRLFVGSAGAAQTAIKSRSERREGERQGEKPFSFEAETQVGATDVMSTYPEEDELEPTVALVEEDEELEPATSEFDLD